MCGSAGVEVPCAIRHLQLQHLTCSVGAQHDTRDGCFWCVCDRASVCSCGVFDFMCWCLISIHCCLLQKSLQAFYVCKCWCWGAMCNQAFTAAASGLQCWSSCTTHKEMCDWCVWCVCVTMLQSAAVECLNSCMGV